MLATACGSLPALDNQGVYSADKWIGIVYPAVYRLLWNGRLERAPMNLNFSP